MDPRRTAIPSAILFVARREISHGIRGANAKVSKFDRGRRSMHTVMWTYKLPTGTPKGQLIETINATAHNYEGIPGLIRKYYGITPDGCSLVGIYLWENVAAANAFHTADWVAMASKRWAVTPQRQDWETPMVVESAERRLIAAQ